MDRSVYKWIRVDINGQKCVSMNIRLILGKILLQILFSTSGMMYRKECNKLKKTGKSLYYSSFNEVVTAVVDFF